MTNGLLIAILGWLRAGYPDGIPPKDFHPLLALLGRSLRPEEVEQVVDQLLSDNADGQISAAEVHAAIEEVKNAPPSEDEVRDVASRLAAAGWPLSTSETIEADRPALLQRIVEWLRAGYPEGVPQTDYIPLLALLRRRLTDDEVKDVARALIAAEQAAGNNGSEISAVDAGVAISKITNEVPAQADLARVRERLAAKGWPLEA